MSPNSFQPLSHARPLKVLTWHVHGSYLNYLAYCGHDLVVPVLPDHPPRFVGRPADATWPANVRELHAEDLHNEQFDVILYQHCLNWTEDRLSWLTEDQLAAIPQAFVEHDPPREHPTDTVHPVDDSSVVIVHVTDFNRLMWDCGRNEVRVIHHGVTVPDDAVWTGEIERGLAAVNNIAARGRRLGLDVLGEAQMRLPIDLVGIHSEEAGGRGEISHHLLPYEIARHRFFFNPIRYTSLGLSVCEAMMVGAPVVGLATTEMSVAIASGITGFVHTDVSRVIDFAERLLYDRLLAAQLGANAREYAREHHGIERFAHEWDELLRELAARA